MELFKALGLDIRILMAQFINFAILLFILYKFAYRPMLKFLDDRKDKIEAGIKNAEAVQAKIAELDKREEEIIRKAKKEAIGIIEESKAKGDERRKEIVERAKEEIGQIINQEKEKIRVEKAETMKQLKNHVSELVIQALEKVLEEKVDKKKDKEIVEDIVKNMKNMKK